MFISIGFLLGHSHGIQTSGQNKENEIFFDHTKRAERKLREEKSLRIGELNSKRINGSMVGVMTLNLCYSIN